MIKRIKKLFSNNKISDKELHKHQIYIGSMESSRTKTDSIIIVAKYGDSPIRDKKLNILHNAQEGKHFTVIDQTGELEKMVKKSNLKADIIELENGSVKYIFNPR